MRRHPFAKFIAGWQQQPSSLARRQHIACEMADENEICKWPVPPSRPPLRIARALLAPTHMVHLFFPDCLISNRVLSYSSYGYTVIPSVH